jgi:hypothetical protein
VLIGFSLSGGSEREAEAHAREELLAKNVDYVVVNTPSAMGAAESRAAILSRDGLALPWAHRPKDCLAREIVRLLGGSKRVPPRRFCRGASAGSTSRHAEPGPQGRNLPAGRLKVVQ